MKVVILAGGFGTRLSEETGVRPKPMVEVGGRPILWHIMKTYSHYGFNEFIICLGYKGYYIKEYFSNYFLHQSDVTFDLANNSVEIHRNKSESWKVTLVDTGVDTMTGSRVKKVASYIDGPFLLTYGDGVADINIIDIVEFHKNHGGLMTISSTQPEGRFGSLDIIDKDMVRSFAEKPIGDGGWINIGYFVCEKKVLDYIGSDDDIVFEREPLENLAKDGELYTYRHKGFWKCMDTLRDKTQLEQLWDTNPKWKVWA
jgi:glucose-1-phosphate cytidylyltransferase